MQNKIPAKISDLTVLAVALKKIFLQNSSVFVWKMIQLSLPENGTLDMGFYFFNADLQQW
jgi:hypothetical protein